MKKKMKTFFYKNGMGCKICFKAKYMLFHFIANYMFKKNDSMLNKRLHEPRHHHNRLSKSSKATYLK